MTGVMSDAVTEFAPAKVNLTLRAGPRRADGYHPLDCLVVFADWGDAIVVRPGEGLHLNLTGPVAPDLRSNLENLVLKAAYALRAAAEKPELGAVITLEKHLPVASGLGGGSSDAAAALRALNRLWELEFSLGQLADIGSVVGADVPACVHAKPLRMSGIGEIIQPLIAWPALHAVVLHPGVPVSTGSVFRAYDAVKPEKLTPGRAMTAGDFEAALGCLALDSNDLQPSAMAQCAAIAPALEALNARTGARLSRMSGSGASCFALFETHGEAEQAAAALDSAHEGWIARAVMFGGAV